MAEEDKTQQQESKWEGKASVESAGLTAEQAWACLEDFCNAHKWLPNLDACYQVDVDEGDVPGHLVRYCAASTTTPPPSDQEEVAVEATTRWVKEKLLVMDPVRRCLSYEVVDNNMGIKHYVATIKIFPQTQRLGCRIEWCYVADPFEGWRFEDLATHINRSLQFMTNKMELAFRPNLSTQLQATSN